MATTPGAGCSLQPLEQFHDHTEKTLLRGVALPAGQSADDDFQAAIENIFGDPSLPPFVCRRLIQNLVKSNPSSAYIGRVSSVFVDDGTGIRGNIGAVVSAILLDPEARVDDAGNIPDPETGLMRDPVLQFASVFRALGATQNLPSPYVGVYENRFDGWLNDLGENPHSAPSVFSFYSPNYTLNSGQYAPEFQIENSQSIGEFTRHTQDWINNDYNVFTSNEFSVDLSPTSYLGKLAEAGGPAALMSALNTLLMHGTMSAQMSDSISTAVMVSILEQWCVMRCT